MKKDKKPVISLAELKAKLEINPEFIAQRKAREDEHARRSLALQAEEEPILEELRAAGWNVKSVWELVNTSASYASIIPILLKHLKFPYSDNTREGIARALAVPDSKFAWNTIVFEYRNTPLKGGASLVKDGLAVALAVIATDEVINTVIDLVKDTSHGTSRILLLRALKKSRSSAAKNALVELSSDPDLAKEIASW
ncbi:MAG: hypothetical protein HY014_18470 [Acidobacteria bacterium]|nr:hypothetical protein [Acidobacteriota bacterium]MBI3490123.1 hypothetical protein [Acidobacteriota bacterium]